MMHCSRTTASHVCTAPVAQVGLRFGVPPLKPFPAAPKQWLMQASAVWSLHCRCLRLDAASLYAGSWTHLQAWHPGLKGACVMRRPLICSMPCYARRSLGPGASGTTPSCLIIRRMQECNVAAVHRQPCFFGTGRSCWCASRPSCWRSITRLHTRPRISAARPCGSSMADPSTGCWCQSRGKPIEIKKEQFCASTFGTPCSVHMIEVPWTAGYMDNHPHNVTLFARHRSTVSCHPGRVTS
jgi:hypothetical protein